MEKLSFQLVLSYLPLTDPQLYVILLLCWCSWLSPGPAWRDPCAANYLCLAASLGAVGEVVLSSSWEISPERHKPGTSAITSRRVIDVVLRPECIWFLYSRQQEPCQAHSAQHMGVTLELPSSSVFLLHPPDALEKRSCVRWKSFFAGFTPESHTDW